MDYKLLHASDCLRNVEVELTAPGYKMSQLILTFKGKSIEIHVAKETQLAQVIIRKLWCHILSD